MKIHLNCNNPTFPTSSNNVQTICEPIDGDFWEQQLEYLTTEKKMNYFISYSKRKHANMSIGDVTNFIFKHSKNSFLDCNGCFFDKKYQKFIFKIGIEKIT